MCLPHWQCVTKFAFIANWYECKWIWLQWVSIFKFAMNSSVFDLIWFDLKCVIFDCQKFDMRTMVFLIWTILHCTAINHLQRETLCVNWIRLFRKYSWFFWWSIENPPMIKINSSPVLSSIELVRFSSSNFIEWQNSLMKV